MFTRALRWSRARWGEAKRSEQAMQQKSIIECKHNKIGYGILIWWRSRYGICATKLPPNLIHTKFNVYHFGMNGRKRAMRHLWVVWVVCVKNELIYSPCDGTVARRECSAKMRWMEDASGEKEDETVHTTSESKALMTIRKLLHLGCLSIVRSFLFFLLPFRSLCHHRNAVNFKSAGHRQIERIRNRFGETAAATPAA